MKTKLIIAAAVVFTLFLGGLLYVDRQVVAQLDFRKSPHIPAVYSDTFFVTSGTSISPGTFKEQLLRRRYRNVTGRPEHPGEFSFDNDSFQVYTREFFAPDGKQRAAQLVTYSPSDGVVGGSGRPGEDSFHLEPQILSHLGSREMKAQNYKTLPEIPETLQHAFIAIEDQRFYHHWGIDLIGVTRAMGQNIRAMAFVQGGSTPTQQLAKNLFFSSRKTLGRKIVEALAAVSLEWRLTKEQILELYLNEVYFGQEGAIALHGVAEAASTFFGKRVEDLSVGESAILAGIVKAPSYYSPKRWPERAKERRNVVLGAMHEAGYIDDKALAKAEAEKISIMTESEHRRAAPHFVAGLERELEAKIDVESKVREGLTVFTGIDPDMQACGEEAVSKHLQALEKQYPRLGKGKIEAALLSIEPHSGKVRAWVGGRDFGKNQFDHVIQAKRQIGSAIKPFLYLTALDPALNTYKVATPQSILADEPLRLHLVTGATWEPENFDKKFRGDVTVRFALENSLNIPAISIAQKVGIPTLVKTLKKFRVTEGVTEVPALALGAADTTLYQVTAAYAALANGGVYVEPRTYISATDIEDKILARPELKEERVANEGPVYVLTNIMQGVIERGTARTIRTSGYQGSAAGKTGTSNDTRDAWFIGFTPDLSTGVWVGFDDNRKFGLTGGAAAAPIWANYMKCVEKFHAGASFLPPPSVTFLDTDIQSGGLATSECPAENIVREVFVRGTEPTQPCRLHSGSPGYRVYQDDLRDTPPAAPERRRRKSFWDSIFG